MTMVLKDSPDRLGLLTIQKVDNNDEFLNISIRPLPGYSV